MVTINYNRVLGANLLLVIVLVGLGVLFNHFYHTSVVERQAAKYADGTREATTTVVVINGVAIESEVVDTPAAREQGLSGRGELEKNHGMLFLFDHPDRYSFWMKDMRFSLDLIWIGSDGRIVDITPDVAPASYPSTFTSRKPVVAVLEVPAGTAKREFFSIGDHVRNLTSRNP